MLKKINRIKSKKDFAEIKDKGVVYNSPIFGVAVLKNTDNSSETNKFGFIVSKKISNRAVDRNRIKRLLSLSVQKNRNEFEPNMKLVFLAKRSILGKSLEEIDKEMKGLVKSLSN